MIQTKLESGVEVVFNTAIGFVIAFCLWPVVAAIVGYDYSTETNLLITTIFTAASLIRGYVIRRWFNAGLHKAAVRLAAGIHNMTRKTT